MPELPEVETIKRIIEPQIKGRRIEKAVLRRPEIIACPTADSFCEQAENRTVTGMERRGKFLIFCLDNESRIILHLRMTGCLLAAPPDFPEEKHTHLIFRLSGGIELRFSDTRRFGRFWLIEKGEADTYSGMEKLGREPLAPDFTADYLMDKLAKRRKAIKECLLDQTAVAGIGNIYSDEILFAARIHPARPAITLTLDEWKRLAAVIPERLTFFIDKNRITPEEYLMTKGRDYRNTPYLQVYGHGGGPCPVCGNTLCRIVIGGRSSVYCPSCQPQKKEEIFFFHKTFIF